MNYWLMKSEPDAYSIDDLKRDKKGEWDGVRNYQARNYMRDDMKTGDKILFYHSGDERAVVGEGRVCSKPYPDPTQFDKKSNYFDPKSTKENSRWQLVDICFVAKYKNSVTLHELKEDSRFSNMMLVTRGRLSIQPVSKKHFELIQELAK